MIEKLIQYIPVIWKAIVATALSVSAEYGLAQKNGITWGEWGYIIATGIGVFLGTWYVKNAGTPVSSAPSSSAERV
jgi:hypothetical protein